MKKVALVFLIVITLTNSVIAQFASIADKNNPQSILYVFQRIGYNFSEVDKIVDSLARNGHYEVSEGFLVPLYDDYEKYVYRHSFELDTVQNVIWHCIETKRGNETIGFSDDNIYRLVNSVNESKLLLLSFRRYDGMEFGVINDVLDFDPQTGNLSNNLADKKLFAIKLKDFFKESTPDSVIQTQVTTDFQITNLTKEGVAECRLSPAYWNRIWSEESFEEINKWLKGDVIHFDFVDGKFIRSEPYFEDKDINE